MRTTASIFLLLTLLLTAAPASASAPQTTPPPPPELPAASDFKAVDRPGDSGKAILLTWKDPATLPEGAMLEVRRAVPPADEFETLTKVAPGTQRFVDAKAEDGKTYRYELRVRGMETPDSLGIAGAVGPALVSDPVSSHDNWFRPERTNSLIANLIFVGLILSSIAAARSGKPIFIRRIAGLNAVDEAIGRATELGKKVLYVPGIQSMDDIQTIASIAILGHVARATARYGTDLDVPNKDPLTFVSAREAVKASYMAEGRPDLYREDMVNYVTYDQFAYTATVSARMIREKPAAIFLVGYFFAESLILAETGQSTGAIQIAGQADPTQLPFFVATCDYTLIGEELYAAGAYLSREPVLLGSMRGQDIAKALLMVVGISGIVAVSLGATWFLRLVQTQ
ncbi:MAG TPA: DUF6754 domain-containing protein [Candidatus Eisenbacteria bacterium]|nr:DUF6754 domain-containing protein [Candidatus Eisenbacteria bacterium]